MNTVHIRNGQIFLLVTALLEGMYPIISHVTGPLFPPITFLTFGSAIAAICFGIGLLISGSRFGMSAKQFGCLCLVVLGTGFHYIVTFLAAPHTSGINTSILIQTEMLFTFVIAVTFFKEKITRMHALGALLVFLGTIVVLFDGFETFLLADLLILAGVWHLPFFNQIAKNLLHTLSPIQLLFWRHLISVFFYGAISLYYEGVDSFVAIPTLQQTGLLLLFSIGLFVVSKFFWYTGLQRLPLSQSLNLVSCRPIFSVLLAIFVLSEIPTLYQIIGFILTIVGVAFIVRKEPTS